MKRYLITLAFVLGSASFADACSSSRPGLFGRVRERATVRVLNRPVLTTVAVTRSVTTRTTQVQQRGIVVPYNYKR